MLVAEATTTDVLQTIFIGGQLTVLSGAAIFGWRQLNEAKQLREEQTRPFVVTDLDSSRPKFFDIVVKNIGATMARDVTFEFDPPVETSDKYADVDKLKMFREGISTLPPGKKYRALLDFGPARHDAELPDVYRVVVSYRGPTGERYKEPMDLDFGLYWNRMYITIHDLHDLHKQVELIANEMRKWTATLGGGLLQVTPGDIEKRQKEIEEQLGKPWWKEGEGRDPGGDDEST